MPSSNPHSPPPSLPPPPTPATANWATMSSPPETFGWRRTRASPTECRYGRRGEWCIGACCVLCVVCCVLCVVCCVLCAVSCVLTPSLPISHTPGYVMFRLLGESAAAQRDFENALVELVDEGGGEGGGVGPASAPASAPATAHPSHEANRMTIVRLQSLRALSLVDQGKRCIVLFPISALINKNLVYIIFIFRCTYNPPPLLSLSLSLSLSCIQGNTARLMLYYVVA